MTGAMQASVVGAGVLTVLVFPLVAVTLQRRKAGTTTDRVSTSAVED